MPLDLQRARPLLQSGNLTKLFVEELGWEAEYRPSGLEGSRWRKRLVTKDDVKQIVTEFKHPHKERANESERNVRPYLASPDQWASSLIVDNAGIPVVYIVQSRDERDHVEVALVRHSDHPLAPTLVRHFFHALTIEPGETANRLISITDPEMSSAAKNALAEIGFFADDNVSWKFSVVGHLTLQELAASTI